MYNEDDSRKTKAKQNAGFFLVARWLYDLKTIRTRPLPKA